MTEQLSLTGDQPIVTADDGTRLGPSQRDLLDELRAHGPLSADEAGAIVHERRQRHPRDVRCAYCRCDGLPVLESLARHGLAAFTRGVGWQAIEDRGVGRSAGESHSQGERSHRNPPESPTPRARLTDPATSHAAARSVGDLRESQAAVLLCFLQHGPMHDEKLEVRYSQRPQQSESGLRTRRRELVDLELLQDAGETTLTVHGRRTTIWELTDQGRAQAQQIASKSTDPLQAIGF